MAKLVTSFDLDGDRASVSVAERRLIGSTPLTIERWAAAGGALGVAASRAVAALEDGRTGADGRPLVEASGTVASLHPEFVAGLAEADAAALGLPSATTLALQIDTQGLVTEESFVARPRWVTPGGGPVWTENRGAFLKQDGRWRRIPEPLYGAHAAAQALATALPEAARFAALARVGAVIDAAASDGGAIARAISAGGYLGALRIHYAAAFSLKLGQDDAFGFEPVLFGPRGKAAAEGGAVLDEDADSLLAPYQQREFAGRAFAGAAEARPAYALKDGAYVFVDPGLRSALSVVRRYRDAPLAERRHFAADPRRVIREALAASGQEPIDVERLFIETEQFSERITGVDVWRTPVTPWIQRKPNAWIPERVGLRVGEAVVEIAPADIPPLADAVDTALSAGKASVHFEGVDIPATPQTQAALTQLREAYSPPPDAVFQEATDAAGPEPARAQPLFLTVEENLEDVTYTRRIDVARAPYVTPKRLRTALKAHQVAGVAWLAEARDAGLPGALLADDMGLGKTLQAIAFLAHLRESGIDGPFLIVAPTGLLANWEGEIERHLASEGLGELRRAFGTGLRLARSQAGPDTARGGSGLDVEDWRAGRLVLTTYETLRDYHFSFARLRFPVVVFDEIQKLKNPLSQQTRAAKTLNVDFAIGMTGTPVENRLQDLWSVVDALVPGLLGSSKGFARAYPDTDAERLKGLKAKLAERQPGAPAVMLRRMKDDVVDGLPPRTVEAERVPMPPIQAERYGAIVKRAMVARGAMSKSDGMLKVLQDMRAVSLHPMYAGEGAGLDDAAFVAASARLAWCVARLDAIRAKGEKVLVFLESLDLQDRLAGILQRRFGLKRPPPRIHGGVSGAQRQKLVDAFQSAGRGFDVMILSPKAGGVGLTLTAANHVIHLSRWWNPAVEDQSSDRVYRIGQAKPVTIHVPLAIHPDPTLAPFSFDVRLDELLARKRTLSRDLLAPVDGDETEALFAAVTGQGDVPQATPDVAEPVPPEPSPPKPAARPLLTAVPKPVAARPLELTWTRRELKIGDPRDLAEVFAPLDGLILGDVLISDPYVIGGHEQREALAAVAEAIARRAKPKRLRIEYRPVDDMRDDRSGETDFEQRRAAQGALAEALKSAGVSIPVDLRRRVREPGRDFHDRRIEALLEGGGPKFIVDLGRGVLGLANRRYETTAFRSWG